MKHKLATALIIISAGGLSALYALEHWPRAQVTAALGAPPTLSPLGAYKDTTDAATPATPPMTPPAPKAAPTTSPQVASLHPKDAEFDRLTATHATPAMLSRAYEIYEDCRRETNALRAGTQTDTAAPNRCQLAPGKPDTSTLKRMLEARVLRSDYGAWIDTVSERKGAFADDPVRWRELVAKAYEDGKRNGEPTVMAAEFRTFYEEGRALHAAGQLAEAQAAYRQAGTYAVAHAANLARQNGQQQADLARDEAWRTVKPLLAASEQAEAINAGKVLAKNWKPS